MVKTSNTNLELTITYPGINKNKYLETNVSLLLIFPLSDITLQNVLTWTLSKKAPDWICVYSERSTRRNLFFSELGARFYWNLPAQDHLMTLWSHNVPVWAHKTKDTNRYRIIWGCLYLESSICIATLRRSLSYLSTYMEKNKATTKNFIWSIQGFRKPNSFLLEWLI